MFRDRFQAGKKLAECLVQYKDNREVIVLAIPRGGLQVGAVLAKNLGLRLDVIITKKIGHPLEKEFAIGAVSLKGKVMTKDSSVLREVSINYITKKEIELQKVIKEKYKMYTGTETPLSYKDMVIVITDDGTATGNTILAAIDVVLVEHPQKIIVAIPVGPKNTVEIIKQKVDELICLETPADFFAVGQFYESFSQVEDKEAIQLLKDTNKDLDTYKKIK